MKECNCGDYKPYIETMEVGAIHAPMMPFNACVNCYGESMKEITLYREDNGQYSTSEARQNDVSGVYVQKEHLTDLQAQNDELRASISILASLPIKIRMECRKQIKMGENPFADTMLEHVQAAISGTDAAQSLADIRAEAVIKAANAVVRHNECGFCLHCLLTDHANKIKGAE